MKNALTPVIYTLGGILGTTYILNAVLAPIYSANCLGFLSYNSPVCATTLAGMTTASLVNYWIYYVALTSVIMWCYVSIKQIR